MADKKHPAHSGFHRTTSTGQSGSNPAGRSRRRLLRALGGSGAALGAVLATEWCKPVVKTVLLPAHAQISGEQAATVSSCAVSVTGTIAYASLVSYSLTVDVDGTVSTTAGVGTSGSLSGVLTLPTGSYSSVGFSNSISPSTGGASFGLSAVCCGGNPTVTGSQYGSGALFISLYGNLVIQDDGQCSFS